ncbi:MAG: zinc-binding alcohol dehydrogenase [bacterium]|nr:zinc-binding alcohol dehydrogenase [bacterium]
MQTKAIFFTGVNQVAVEAVEIPEPGAGEVLVETAFSCISPGTELRCLAGKQPNAEPWPFVPGYALTGRVIQTGAGVTLPIGTPVFCTGTKRASKALMWGGHVGHAVQPAEAVFPIPEGLTLHDAALAKLAAIAYHGLRLSRPQPHENVAVVGLGVLGQLSARLHGLTGANVVGADLSQKRVAKAHQGRVEAVQINSTLVEAFAGRLPGGADVIVDATGAAGVIGQAIALVRDIPWDDHLNAGARYVVQGSYPDTFTIPYQDAFMKECSFLIPRDTQPRDLRAVLDLMAQGKLPVRDLIGVIRPPEAAPDIYASLRQPDTPLLTALFQWSP